MTNENQEWDLVIKSKSRFLSVDLKEIWKYRDLLFLLVKRDILAFYKQTILGPVWFFIQPLFTMAVYVFVFGTLAGLSTDGLPQPLFYLVGITFWTYFSQTLLKTSTVLRTNVSIFGKVYFPRVIMPLSLVFSNLFRLGIQFSLLMIISVYYVFQGFQWEVTYHILYFPILVIMLAMQGMGFGMMISALTTKYRDLVMFLTFGVQLIMYAAPVVYPMSSLTGRPGRLIGLNPVSYIFEGLRKALYNEGTFDEFILLRTLLITVVIFLVGFLIFNKAEKSFVDTI